MKIKFTFLYKNGLIESFVQETEEKELNGLLEVIETTITEDNPGMIRLVDGDATHYVRMSDVTGATVQEVKEESKWQN